MSNKILTDNFGRAHNYLRISLTERCNLRCTYCMPLEGIPLRDRAEFMRQEELFEIAKTFVDLGVTKIRLTGGEPLIKKNFSSILSDLSSLPVELAMTTNAVLLDRYIDDLIAAKLSRINISIDSLQEDKFNRIARRVEFKRVMKNIDLALEKGFNVKLNVVLMKGENDDEINDFIAYTRLKNVGIRFIEFMPFSGNAWDWSKKISFSEIISKAKNHFGEDSLEELPVPPNSTSKNFKIKGYKGDFGIISTLTNPFCDSCNRIRLTADGKVKNCLFSSEESDLLSNLRQGKDIIPFIRQTIQQKKKNRAGITSFESAEGKLIFDKNRSMTTIGG